MIKIFHTPLGTYKTGLYQSPPGGRWYGRELPNKGLEVITKQAFEAAINTEKVLLDPLPF